MYFYSEKQKQFFFWGGGCLLCLVLVSFSTLYMIAIIQQILFKKSCIALPRAVKSCWLCQGFETFTWMGQLTSISNCKLHDLKPSQFYCVGWKNLHATRRFVGVFNTNYSVCIPTASLLYLPVAFIILWMQSLSVRIKVLKISSNITQWTAVPLLV